MVPIYDSDLAEERFTQGEWNHYELWEKVETRLRRRRRLWILGTLTISLALSAVPIVADRWPKWKALAATRRLAQEINRLKRDASVDHAAYRIRFSEGPRLEFQVERAASCSDPSVTPVRSGSLLGTGQPDGFVLMSTQQGTEVGVSGLVQVFCYDFLAGSDAVLRGDSLIGFGVLPVKDLTDRRLDRLSVLTLGGPSAEISFE